MPNNQLPLLPLILDDVPAGLRQALAQEGVPFRNLVGGAVKGPPEGRFLLFDSRRCSQPRLAAGQKPVDVDQFRRPSVTNASSSGIDPFEALEDVKSARVQWKIAGLTLAENAARFDKRSIRRELMGRLRRVIEEHGGVWLRLAAYPFPYRGVFNFRIDYDEFDARDFAVTLDAIGGHEYATSHFINASNYARAGDVWRRFRGLDVGSHGYWHHPYRTEEENLRNIRRGIETIESHGIATSGFTAPHGRFYPQLHAAMTRLNISHSSEFALAYDELPFYYSAADTISVEKNQPLQIPVHPVCLALFLEAAQATSGNAANVSASAEKARERSAVRAAIEHFCGTSRQRYQAGEPIFLYGHPTWRLGRHPQVLSELFATVSGFAAVWQVTMTRFADWWRARLTARLSVSLRGDQYVVSARDLSPAYRFGIEFFRDRHVALMPLDRLSLSFSPTALAYENRESQTTFRPVRVDRPHGLKNHIRHLIDWERVTPIDEIGAATWRHHAKRALRRLLRP